MTNLSINLNKIALLRNQRHVGYPNVVDAARTVIEAGAHGVTIHPRPDQRHIRNTDVYELADFLKNYPEIEFNIEGNPFESFIKFCEDTRPHQATLVPDAPGVATSDTGWDIAADGERLRSIIAELKALGCRVSLFMNPDPTPMANVADIGADRIELYTGPWAEAFGTDDQARVVDLYAQSAQAAVDAGLLINAGHDLTTDNIGPLKSALPRLDEVSIGHAFTSDALWKGMTASVQGFLSALDV